MQTKENHKFLVRNKGKDQLEFAYMLAEQITIPERSFIRSTFDEQAKAWSDYALNLVKNLLLEKWQQKNWQIKLVLVCKGIFNELSEIYLIRQILQ